MSVYSRRSITKENENEKTNENKNNFINLTTESISKALKRKLQCRVKDKNRKRYFHVKQDERKSKIKKRLAKSSFVVCIFTVNYCCICFGYIFVV